MAIAASAVARMSGVSSEESAALLPGSMRSSRTSVGRAPERVTSSTSTPSLGPVHSGSVPPRAGVADSGSEPTSALSVPPWIQSPQFPPPSGAEYAGEYFAGYVTEKSLSVDNLFVFVLIMAAFAVPRELQQKVLLFGITFALALRTVFILVGAAAIENFSWVFYLFGAILIYTAWVQARSGGHSGEEDYQENAVLRFVRRILPTTEEYHSDRMTVRIQGKRFITPLAIALIAIGSADVIFAVDSIPAIFGLTQETYLVFAANAFSLLGL